MKEESKIGKVVRVESKDYYVYSSDEKEIRCSLRGKFKKIYALKKNKQYLTDIVTVGDNIVYNVNEDGSGTIFDILDRKNYLSRKAPKIKGASFRGERLEQKIAANVDNLVIVASIENPPFNSRVIDRLIVAGESSHIRVIIVINKVDLDESDSSKEWAEMYSSLGYEVVVTSCKTQSGIDELKQILKNKTSVFWGNSGVGKSSVLNVLYPNLNLKVGVISEASNRGRHTTVTSVLKKVEENTFIIDTPGIREIDPYGIKKQDLGHYFVEFEDYIHGCKFNTCVHDHEPGCAISKAVEDEEISFERYESYLNILDTVEEDINF